VVDFFQVDGGGEEVSFPFMGNNDLGAFAISLTVNDGRAALEFYEKAFGAKELFRMELPEEMGGGIAHAEFMLGEQLVYLSEESPDWKAYAMKEGQLASCLFATNVKDSDESFTQALAAGATEISGPTDQPWGWRTAVVQDPFGYRWNVRQFLEDVSEEELRRRFAEIMG